MSTINGKVCVVDGVAVDKVFSNSRQVYGRNLLAGIDSSIHQATRSFQLIGILPRKFIKVGETLCFSAFINNASHAKILAKGNTFCIMQAIDASGNTILDKRSNYINFDADGISQVSMVIPDKTVDISLFIVSNNMPANTYYGYPKVEFGDGLSNGSQVYGRNYFLDSKTRIITPPGTANFDWRIYITDYFWENPDRLKSNNVKISFTLSAQKALTTDFNSGLYFSATPWPAKYFSYPAGTTVPKKYELVFNITDSAFKANTCFLRFQAKDTSDFPFVLENAKLEIGTTFTDWSPAPEDVM